MIILCIRKDLEVFKAKVYYVERADVWVVVGLHSQAMREAVSKQFSDSGVKVIFCDSFEKV